MQKHLEKRGKHQGIADFMTATGKGQRTIERWLEGSNPDFANGKAVALACGCTEDEADALAGAGLVEAKETA
jgi:hypothetical protein